MPPGTEGTSVFLAIWGLGIGRPRGLVAVVGPGIHEHGGGGARPAVNHVARGNEEELTCLPGCPPSVHLARSRRCNAGPRNLSALDPPSPASSRLTYYKISSGTLTSHELHRKGQKKNPGQQLDDVDMLTI